MPDNREPLTVRVREGTKNRGIAIAKRLNMKFWQLVDRAINNECDSVETVPESVGERTRTKIEQLVLLADEIQRRSDNFETESARKSIIIEKMQEKSEEKSL